jgi:molecular chaperone Hsp33
MTKTTTKKASAGRKASAGDDSNDATGDLLLRAILPTRSLRLVVAVTTGVAREAARRHGAVGGAAAALGRGATAGLLLATLTKDRERITAEVKGDGPLGPLMIDANAAGEARVYIRSPGLPVAAMPGAHVALGRAIGTQGLVRVARDLGLREIVNGQTPLVDGEIDTDLEHYLDSSEQVPSALGCEALLGSDLEITVAGGVLLQTLPGSEALPLLEEMRAKLRAGALTRALAAVDAGAGNVDPRVLAEALLAEVPGLAEDMVGLDLRPLRFFCPCSRERALGTLGVLSFDDLTEMVAAGTGAEVTCEFCRARHMITPEELEQVREEARAARPS